MQRCLPSTPPIYATQRALLMRIIVISTVSFLRSIVLKILRCYKQVAEEEDGRRTEEKKNARRAFEKLMI